ncbi:SusE domain-containing protein [Bacteroides sp.]
MKKIYLYTLLLGLAGLTSCEDDASPVLSVKSNAELEALPQSEYTFTETNADDPFTVKWSPTDFGFQAVNTYTVTLSNPANGKSVKLGTTSDNELALTNGQINSYLGQLNIYPGKAGDLAISLGYSAYEGKLDSVAGNVITFKATPYDPKAAGVTWNYAYVATYPAAATRAAGDVDWDWTKAYMIGDVDGDGIYEGWVNIDADGTNYKILDGKTYEVLAEGSTIEKKGFYQIKMAGGIATTTAEPMIWGVVGNATTSGDWTNEIAMEYNPDTRLWTIITTLFAKKEFKFKSDKDVWLGVASGEELNMGGEINGANNIEIIADKDTTYLVTLNLTEAGKYSYSLEPVKFEQSSEFITLPGTYQSTVKDEQWKPEEETAIKLISKDRDFIYTGSGYMTAGTFKFYDAGTWYGLDGKIAWDDDNKMAGSMAINTSGGDIKMEKDAYYQFDVNIKKGTVKFHKASWEVIGDATPGAWDKGTVMDYNPTTKLWSVTVTLTDGKMKFRWDGGWGINLGESLGALTQNGNNIAVSAGTYEIVLNTEAKTATMTKK